MKTTTHDLAAQQLAAVAARRLMRCYEVYVRIHVKTAAFYFLKGGAANQIVSLPAPKAHPIPAWANGPGGNAAKNKVKG